MTWEIITISTHPELKEAAAAWFHEKWGIPLAAYLDSMEACIECKGTVPEWYLALKGGEIVGGMGVIDNDFHRRTDLTPNVCAVYTEAAYRCHGIAGALLDYVSADMKSKGIDTLYLVTSHTSFYERYGWEFFCTVQCDDGEDSRMYIHRC